MLYTHIAQWIGFIFAQFTNILLLVLIWSSHAQKLIGSYRHVMSVFAIYSILYTWVEVITLPSTLVYSPVFAVITGRQMDNYEGLAYLLSALHCGMFACCVTLLAAHFGYRYIAFSHCLKLHKLKGFGLIRLFIPCIFVFIIFFNMVYFGWTDSVDKKHYLKDIIRKSYDRDSFNTPFTCIMYWEYDENGELIWRITDILLALSMMNIITICFIVILYWGLQIYYSMKNGLRSMSPLTKEVNRQLFTVMIIQTICPAIMMYIPVAVFLTLPFFDINISVYISNIPASTIGVYPSIEPLIAIYCIKDFKKTVFRLFRTRKDNTNMLTFHYVQYIGFVGAQITNSILLYLILKKAQRLLGSYRHVMSVFAIYSMFFSFVETVAQPITLIHSPEFIVISDSVFKESSSFGFLLLVFYGSTYFCCIAFLAAHFAYRYIVFSFGKYLHRLTGIGLVRLFFPCFLTYLISFSILYFGLNKTVEKQEYIKEFLWDSYDVDVFKIEFLSLMYWDTDENGVETWRLGDISLGVAMTCILAVSIFTIVFCGMKIYKNMNENGASLSQKTKELNKQLFVTLVVQTILPTIMMYTPVAVYIFLPLAKVDIPLLLSNIPAVSLGIYPALEPLIAIYCIREFRCTVLRAVRLSKSGSVMHSNTQS